MERTVNIDTNKLVALIQESELFTKRFGSFNKSDYEVLMFTVFLDSVEKDIRDYDISIALGIPESKVRLLRVKSQLQYPREIHWVEQLTTALEHGFYDDGMITITIENPSARNRIRYEVESKFGTVNLSLNSKQLVLPVESFLLLAACAEEDTKSVLKKLNKQIESNEEIKGKIQKENVRVRLFRNVSNMGELLQSILTVYTYGRPIIEAIIQLIPK